MYPMKDRIKLPVCFDPDRLQEDLRRLHSIEWIAHFVTQNYEGDWSVIPLRGPEGATHPVMMIYSDPTCETFADTPFLKGLHYIQEVLKSLHCPLLAVRLMKLSAGSQIKEHSDLDLAAEYGTVRLHIPIHTSDDVEFILNGTRVILNEGECWYLRLSDPHSVNNQGKSDRVHLVVDAKMNDWLQALLIA
jgi:hypothetical protein